MEVHAGLNEAQRRAVETTDGPLLVLAGAGAGKTRVIAHRILNIVEKHRAAPEQILAITFTNKAAKEMRERVISMLIGAGAVPRSVAGRQGNSPQGTAPAPYVSTFHSLGLLIIKENAKLLGFTRTPVIYDRADSMREMKAALKQFDDSIDARVALGTISRAKGDGIERAEFMANADGYQQSVIAKAWTIYDEALRKDQALDFDDLLLRAVGILRAHETVRQAYHARWKYIHVDEYQDTNAIQAQLLEFLVGPERHVCAVGDVDQTIYGWRGAQIKNILSFEKTYPGNTKPIMLEQNYRSTKVILEAANALIANNPNRPEKNLFTDNTHGLPISLYVAGDGGDEALFVANKIQEGLSNGRAPKDFAVLYRANFQSRAIEEKLLNAGISYQVLGTRFFERKEVKDVLSFVRFGVSENAADFGRVLDTLPGIGKVSKLKILSGQEHTLSGKIGERVAFVRQVQKKIQAAAITEAPSQLLRMIIVDSGIEKELREDKIEGAERLENLRELVSLASRYDPLPLGEGLAQFLESAALASDQDELKEEQNAVRLMTVHAAKGLEFPVVFIVGLEEGLFPYKREDAGDDIEEERRLMYVALTRAREKVYLSFAMMRTVFGATDFRTPSSFLEELPKEHLEAITPERLGKTIYLD